MALENLINGSNTDEGDPKNQELVQFEKCKYDTNCKWCDTNGICVFETCVVQNEIPPAQELWFYRCIACNKIDSIKPNEMKIFFCRSCIRRLQKAETLPFNCIICGSSQGHPAKGFSTPICDKCISDLKGLTKHWEVKGPWVS